MLKNIDLFGVSISQEIARGQLTYRSNFGGLITLIIMMTSMTYAIWVFIQWKSNQLYPKVNTSSYKSDFSDLDLTYDVIKISLWNSNNGYIDPVKEKILIPYVQYYDVITGTLIEKVIQLQKGQGNDSLEYLIPQMNISVGTVNGQQITTQEMYIQFVLCTQDLLQDGEKCAEQDLIDQFFSQPMNSYLLEVHQKNLDPSNQQIQETVQYYYSQIEKQVCQTLTVYLQTSVYEIFDYVLFGNPKQKEYLTDSIIQSQTNSQEYCTTAVGNPNYFMIYVIMNSNSKKVIFDYPKIGDVLANIGSIVSLLLMIKYIIIWMNSKYLNKQLLDDIIQFYYPQFKNIKIIKNWKQTITQIQYKGKNLNVNFDDFKKYYETLQAKAYSKLNYANLLYELSRLYLIIRSFKCREEIQKSHQIGIQIKQLRTEMINQELFSKSFRENDIQLLQDEDFNILSLYNNNQDIKLEQNEDSLRVDEYYLCNNID